MLYSKVKAISFDDPGPIFPGAAPFIEAELMEIAVLENGCESGKSSVMIHLKDPNGNSIVVQTSAAIYLMLGVAVDAIRQRFDGTKYKHDLN